jgi:hypothetical protein
VTALVADELLRRFPELSALASEGDDDLPYVMMSHLVEFLDSSAAPLSQDVVRRLSDFGVWSKAQARGTDAGNDIATITAVGLLEKLLESDNLYYLVPKLISKSELTGSQEYIVQWAGQKAYDRALALFR